MDRIDFRNNYPEKITQLFIDNGFSLQKINNFKKSFRNNNISSLDEIKGVKGFDTIIDQFPFYTLDIIDSIKDRQGNEKFIFSTSDNLKIESIFMPNKSNISICVSTQVGCRMKCIFCKTGNSGFKRNLLASEILEQVRHIYLQRIYPSKIDCVTFMGMGEPFDNIENCHIAFLWLNSDWGYQVSREKITFSTIVNKNFKDFLEWNKVPNLAISLHSANNEKRKYLIPSAVYNLNDIKELIIKYTEKTGKQITIEYCMINGINDSIFDAKELGAYLKNIKCKVNLLNYNMLDDFEFKPVSEKKLIEFKDIIKKYNMPVLIRKSLGTEIKAGCGQLG